MKALSVALLFLLVSFLWASRWYPDFREGVSVAKEEGKLVLVYFYENGCSYCKYMEEVVFIDPKVSSLMDRAFVVVPINVEDIPGYLDRRFRVIGTPTFFIYDPYKDEIVMQVLGLQETEQFLGLLTRACTKFGSKRC